MKKSNQIGGKGTMRRKKIIKRDRQFSQKKTQEQIILDNRIQNINTHLDNIPKEFTQIAIISINDIVSSHFDDLERYDVKKKENFKIIKNDVITFFENNCVNKTDTFYHYRSNIYQTLKNIFIQDCIPYLLDIFIDIENYLVKKDYLNHDKQTDTVEMTDTQCFEILNLDLSETPTKEQLKKSYKTLTKLNHPDKHPDEFDKYQTIFSKISVAYKLIKKRYNL